MKKIPKRQIVGVLGLPINNKGQFLLTLRNDPQHSNTHDRWQITGGGLEFGETPEQTLARELQEELQVFAQILHPQPIVKTHVWDFKTINIQVILMTFIVDISNQKLVCDREEIKDYGWFSFKEALTLDSLPNVDKVILEAQAIIEDNNLLSKLS